jgi:DNA-binding transcriptional MerR regulator
MAYKDRDISKMYYTMGEVAILFDVKQSLIRYYEREFDVLELKKNKKGDRYFSKEDVEVLGLIIHLIKDKGYTLQGARDYIKNNRKTVKDDMRILNSLENLKKFLIDVRDQM